MSFLVDVADDGDLFLTVQGGNMRAWLVMKGKFIEISVQSAYKMKQNDNDVSFAEPLITTTAAKNQLNPPGTRATD